WLAVWPADDASDASLCSDRTTLSRLSPKGIGSRLTTSPCQLRSAKSRPDAQLQEERRRSSTRLGRAGGVGAAPRSVRGRARSTHRRAPAPAHYPPCPSPTGVHP